MGETVTSSHIALPSLSRQAMIVEYLLSTQFCIIMRLMFLSTVDGLALGSFSCRNHKSLRPASLIDSLLPTVETAMDCVFLLFSEKRSAVALLSVQRRPGQAFSGLVLCDDFLLFGTIVETVTGNSSGTER